MSETGGINASIPLQAKAPPPPDPIAQIGNFANAANALNQLKLFPGQQALQGQAVQGGAVNLSQQINQAVNQSLTPLLAQPAGSITHKALTDALGGVEARGVPTGGFLGALNSMAPMGDGPAFDQAIRSLITSQAMKSPENSVAAVTGTPTQINQGPFIQTGITPGPGAPGFGTFQAHGGAVPVGLSPSESASQVGRPVTAQEAVALGVPPGTIINETLAQRLQQQGAGSLVNPAPGASGPSPMGTGRLPPALLNPNRTPVPVIGALDPATQAALTTKGPQSQVAFQGVTDRGNQAVQQNAILSNMQNDLAQFASGTGVNKTLDFKRAIVSWAPQLAPALGVDPKSVAANESFDKLAAQIADAQGAGSDHRLDVTQAANPHAGLSPEGADLIIRQLRGNTDYLRAQQQLAVQYPDKTDYQGFTARLAANLDPRAFQFAQLSPAQKQTYFQSMSPADKAALKKSYGWAQAQGLIGTPNAGQ